jgi:hypothetical protein
MLLWASGIEFDRDDENRKHLAPPQLSSAEFEELVNNDPLDEDCDFDR